MTEHAMQAYFELHAAVVKRAEFIIDNYAPSTRSNTDFRLGDKRQWPDGRDEDVEINYHDGYDGNYETVPTKWFWMEPADVLKAIDVKHAEQEAERVAAKARSEAAVEDQERKLLARLKEKYRD